MGGVGVWANAWRDSGRGRCLGKCLEGKWEEQVSG